MKNIWSFLCFIVLTTILLLDSSSRSLNASSDGTLKIINANEINLVDKTGRKCATLFVNSQGEASLQLGPAKTPGFVVTVISPDGVSMYKGEQGKPPAMTNLGADLATTSSDKGKITTIWDTSQKE